MQLDVGSVDGYHKALMFQEVHADATTQNMPSCVPSIMDCPRKACVFF